MEPAEIERFISELEIAVDRLRSLYDQYFMGIEKLEPTVPRKEVERRIQVLRKEQIRNTAQRFRFQMLLQRHNTFLSHWQRICREIENGTYKRHLRKAIQRFGDGSLASRRSVAPPSAAVAPLGRAGPSAAAAAELAALDREFAATEELADTDLELLGESAPAARKRAVVWRKASPEAARHVSQAPPKAPAMTPAGRTPERTGPAAGATVRSGPTAPPPVAPPAALGPAASQPSTHNVPPPAARAVPQPPRDELPDERVRQLYAQYVETKRKQNESTAAITYDGVARTLRESSAKLRERHGKAVDFEVAVKDGKTVLKPVLK